MARCAAPAIALAAGGASVFSFAPFGGFPVAFISLALLACMLGRVASPRAGFALGFAWGFGAFAAGVSWLFVAIHRYGGMPAPLATLAIALFCAYLALYPALAGALFVRLRRAPILSAAALFAALWIGSEMLRGWMFTGFPWLAIAYSQTPPSPFAGWRPVLGVSGGGGVVAFLSALLGLARWGERRDRFALVVCFVVLAGLGWALGRVTWTTPVGEPLRVALVQTDVAQDLKWRPERVREWLDLNLQLSDQPGADLVVLPESTLPMLVEFLPQGYLDFIAERARTGGADVLLGVFERDGEGRVFNTVMSFGASPPQRYAKRHLVPFGEYSPPLFGWFYELADIPMSDQTAGDARQPALSVGGQRVAVNICYDDLFGRELLYALPDATLMLNVSNLAWYGDSFAQPQHLQIARARALETGRPMMRSTNTGMTAVVLPDGSVSAALPAFERGVLHVEVTGHAGMTPYARWGDAAALLLAGLWFVLARPGVRRQ